MKKKKIRKKCGIKLEIGRKFFGIFFKKSLQAACGQTAECIQAMFAYPPELPNHDNVQ